MEQQTEVVADRPAEKPLTPVEANLISCTVAQSKPFICLNMNSGEDSRPTSAVNTVPSTSLKYPIDKISKTTSIEKIPSSEAGAHFDEEVPSPVVTPTVPQKNIDVNVTTDSITAVTKETSLIHLEQEEQHVSSQSVSSGPKKIDATVTADSITDVTKEMSLIHLEQEEQHVSSQSVSSGPKKIDATVTTDSITDVTKEMSLIHLEQKEQHVSSQSVSSGPKKIDATVTTDSITDVTKETSLIHLEEEKQHVSSQSVSSGPKKVDATVTTDSITDVTKETSLIHLEQEEQVSSQSVSSGPKKIDATVTTDSITDVTKETSLIHLEQEEQHVSSQSVSSGPKKIDATVTTDSITDVTKEMSLIHLEQEEQHVSSQSVSSGPKKIDATVTTDSITDVTKETSLIHLEEEKQHVSSQSVSSGPKKVDATVTTDSITDVTKETSLIHLEQEEQVSSQSVSSGPKKIDATVTADSITDVTKEMSLIHLEQEEQHVSSQSVSSGPKKVDATVTTDSITDVTKETSLIHPEQEEQHVSSQSVSSGPKKIDATVTTDSITDVTKETSLIHPEQEEQHVSSQSVSSGPKKIDATVTTDSITDVTKETSLIHLEQEEQHVSSQSVSSGPKKIDATVTTDSITDVTKEMSLIHLEQEEQHVSSQSVSSGLKKIDATVTTDSMTDVTKEMSLIHLEQEEQHVRSQSVSSGSNLVPAAVVNLESNSSKTGGTEEADSQNSESTTINTRSKQDSELCIENKIKVRLAGSDEANMMPSSPSIEETLNQLLLDLQQIENSHAIESPTTQASAIVTPTNRKENIFSIKKEASSKFKLAKSTSKIWGFATPKHSVKKLLLHDVLSRPFALSNTDSLIPESSHEISCKCGCTSSSNFNQITGEGSTAKQNQALSNKSMGMEFNRIKGLSSNTDQTAPLGSGPSSTPLKLNTTQETLPSTSEEERIPSPLDTSSKQKSPPKKTSDKIHFVSSFGSVRQFKENRPPMQTYFQDMQYSNLRTYQPMLVLYQTRDRESRRKKALPAEARKKVVPSYTPPSKPAHIDVESFWEKESPKPAPFAFTMTTLPKVLSFGNQTEEQLVERAANDRELFLFTETSPVTSKTSKLLKPTVVPPIIFTAMQTSMPKGTVTNENSEILSNAGFRPFRVASTKPIGLLPEDSLSTSSPLANDFNSVIVSKTQSDVPTTEEFTACINNEIHETPESPSKALPPGFNTLTSEEDASTQNKVMTELKSAYDVNDLNRTAVQLTESERSSSAPVLSPCKNDCEPATTGSGALASMEVAAKTNVPPSDTKNIEAVPVQETKSSPAAVPPKDNTDATSDAKIKFKQIDPLFVDPPLVPNRYLSDGMLFGEEKSNMLSRDTKVNAPNHVSEKTSISNLPFNFTLADSNLGPFAAKDIATFEEMKKSHLPWANMQAGESVPTVHPKDVLSKISYSPNIFTPSSLATKKTFTRNAIHRRNRGKIPPKMFAHYEISDHMEIEKLCDNLDDFTSNAIYERKNQESNQSPGINPFELSDVQRSANDNSKRKKPLLTMPRFNSWLFPKVKPKPCAFVPLKYDGTKGFSLLQSLDEVGGNKPTLFSFTAAQTTNCVPENLEHSRVATPHLSPSAVVALSSYVPSFATTEATSTTLTSKAVSEPKEPLLKLTTTATVYTPEASATETCTLTKSLVSLFAKLQSEALGSNSLTTNIVSSTSDAIKISNLKSTQVTQFVSASDPNPPVTDFKMFSPACTNPQQSVIPSSMSTSSPLLPNFKSLTSTLAKLQLDTFSAKGITTHPSGKTDAMRNLKTTEPAEFPSELSPDGSNHISGMKSVSLSLCKPQPVVGKCILSTDATIVQSNYTFKPQSCSEIRLPNLSNTTKVDKTQLETTTEAESSVTSGGAPVKHHFALPTQTPFTLIGKQSAFVPVMRPKPFPFHKYQQLKPQQSLFSPPQEEERKSQHTTDQVESISINPVMGGHLTMTKLQSVIPANPSEHANLDASIIPVSRESSDSESSNFQSPTSDKEGNRSGSPVDQITPFPFVFKPIQSYATTPIRLPPISQANLFKSKPPPFHFTSVTLSKSSNITDDETNLFSFTKVFKSPSFAVPAIASSKETTIEDSSSSIAPTHGSTSTNSKTEEASKNFVAQTMSDSSKPPTPNINRSDPVPYEDPSEYPTRTTDETIPASLTAISIDDLFTNTASILPTNREKETNSIPIAAEGVSSGQPKLFPFGSFNPDNSQVPAQKFHFKLPTAQSEDFQTPSSSFVEACKRATSETPRRSVVASRLLKRAIRRTKFKLIDDITPQGTNDPPSGVVRSIDKSASTVEPQHLTMPSSGERPPSAVPSKESQ